MTKDELVVKHGSLLSLNLDFDSGWVQLIDMLCVGIKYTLDIENDFKFIQIKEKFGGLRIYTEGGNSEVIGMINMIRLLSHNTCELCGTNQEIGQTKGRIKTICRSCAINTQKLPVWELKSK